MDVATDSVVAVVPSSPVAAVPLLSVEQMTQQVMEQIDWQAWSDKMMKDVREVLKTPEKKGRQSDLQGDQAGGTGQRGDGETLTGSGS